MYGIITSMHNNYVSHVQISSCKYIRIQDADKHRAYNLAKVIYV